ncbi:MAG: ABC transporter substrate-binding protein [Bacteroidota bacterium]
MRLPRFCITLACLLVTHALLAHVDRELLQQYKAAKRYYAAADYEAAKAALAPWINADSRHAITPYVLFYYALSAYHNEEPTLAERTFEMIIEAFPDWEQKDEVWYWLGQLSFEAEAYDSGLSRLAQITTKGLEAPARQMKVYFLQRLDDIFLLQSLYRQYPEDEDVASVLFEYAVQQPLISRDLDLIDTLARNFNFKFGLHDPLRGVLSSKKDSYNIGVFLPFFVDEVDYEEESSNSFVVALYQGIKAAVAELADQGIKINLYAYDTKKDPVVTAALLEQEEVKTMDLIIGPLYAATISLVSDFVRTYQINLINPLSENKDVVGDNPFVFLFKSSLETQAQKAAEFTLQNYSDGDRRNVGIVYGTSKADSLQAQTYKQYIEHSTGQAVALMLSVAPEEAYNILNAPEEVPKIDGEEPQELQEEKQQPVSLDGLTHLYVASKDELIVANLLSAVETLQHPPCIIGHESWLQHNLFTFDQLKQHRLFFVAPNHITYEKASLHKFRNSFYDRFAQYPNTYACIGYEMMLLGGRMLAQYGTYFQKHWEKAFYQGAIFQGAAYGTHHDNQHVPIVRFHKGQFVICNQ